MMRDLRTLGIGQPGPVHWNLSPPALTEMSVQRREGMLSAQGALVVQTGKRTGRSPRDRFIVAEPEVRPHIAWGAVNQPMQPDVFEKLFQRAHGHTRGRELYVFEGWAGADPRYRLPIRVVTEKAWHSLFAHTLFCRPTAAELERFQPGFTVLNLCDLHAVPARDDTQSEVCVAISFARRLVLIFGTQYAGEIKKSIFSVLNYLLPERNVLPMHCSANLGAAGDTALFFGLSGTGKTTLSADPHRRLIGDDEHGWSETGVFNFEGGCYAKTIRLSRTGEPQIWNAIRFGSVLENVVIDSHLRIPNYDDGSITENTRVTYPVEHIDHCVLSGQGGHPANVMFLTCDAFGVLPPISKLSHEQAVEHFLLGYTAKVAGTEQGVTKPEATFSTCFGAPFMPLPPHRYGEMLRQRLIQHSAQVWLINTGWSGGPAGQVPRMKLAYTRALLNAALAGQLRDVAYRPDPVFGLQVPQACPGVPSEILNPRDTWTDPAAYDAQAKRLADLFKQNSQAGAQKGSTEG